MIVSQVQVQVHVHSGMMAASEGGRKSRTGKRQVERREEESSIGEAIRVCALY